MIYNNIYHKIFKMDNIYNIKKMKIQIHIKINQI